MDIAALVRAVIAAFDDASKLVSRIRDQRNDTDRTLAEEPTRDLIESLALGPVIVRGHYDHDVKRFGEPYACGDVQAREQMKDVLISLQMSLIITLRGVWMDDVDLDFNALQTASDDCRVNAGVCLGQLSQRLSDSVRVQAMYPQHMAPSYGSPVGTLVSPISPSLAYSSSRSTHSSGGYLSARTPDNISDHFAGMSMSTSTVRPPIPDRKWTNSSGSSSQPEVVDLRQYSVGSNGSFGGLPLHGVHRVSDADALSVRRPSSHTLAPEDSELLSPINGVSPPGPNTFAGSQAGSHDIDRESLVSSLGHSVGQASSVHSHSNSSPEISRQPSIQQTGTSRDRDGPEDFTPVLGKGEFNYASVYDVYRSQSQMSQASGVAPLSYSDRAHEGSHSTLEHIRFLQQNSRPPRTGMHQLPPRQAPRYPPPPPPQFSNFRPRDDSLNSSSPVGKPMPPLPNSPVQDTMPPPYPKSSPPADMMNRSRIDYSRPSVSAPIPVIRDDAIPSAPHNSVIAAPAVQPPRTIATSITKFSFENPNNRPVTSLSIPSNVPLTLPTDKNLMGFCKGAYRLFLGLDRKAFTLSNRPFGMSGMMSYWGCSKCHFEGPVVSSIVVSDQGGKKSKKGKEEKIFDNQVRVSKGGGVRYRWSFLAKCHVQLKTIVDQGSRAQREGEVGGFGCIFCAAEGSARGWIGAANQNGNGSIRSGSSGGGGDGKSAPVFGNVASFMEHLEMHRKEEGWPGAEMLGRMKCVVGKVAGGDEEWEVNFVPIQSSQ